MMRPANITRSRECRFSFRTGTYCYALVMVLRCCALRARRLGGVLRCEAPPEALPEVGQEQRRNMAPGHFCREAMKSSHLKRLYIGLVTEETQSIRAATDQTVSTTLLNWGFCRMPAICEDQATLDAPTGQRLPGGDWRIFCDLLHASAPGRAAAWITGALEVISSITR